LKDKDNDLETNNKNKSVRKLHSYKNTAFVSSVGTVPCNYFLVTANDLHRLSTAFK